MIYGVIPGFTVFLLLSFAAWGKLILKFLRRMWGSEKNE